MGRATVARGRAARWGVLGAAGACVIGLMSPTVAEAAPAAAPPAGAAVVGTASASCRNPAFPTIQAAVTATAAGGTIYVCPGTYTGTVTIPKTLRLLGAQYGRDARAGRTTTAQESVVTSSAGAGFAVAGGVAGVTVDGFTFSGSTGDGIDAFRGGGPGLTVVDNVFTGNHNGMNVNATGPARSTIARNRFTANNAGGGDDSGTGVLFTSGPADNVTVSDNLFERHTSAAVNSIGDGSNRSTGIVISSNRSVDDSSFAVINNADGAVVTNNHATKAPSAVDGTIIYIVGNTDQLTVSRNILSGDTGTGISANAAYGSGPSTNLLIESNIIRNRTTGIAVNNAHHSVTIRSNVVQNATRAGTTLGHGIRVAPGSDGLTVTNNAVVGSSDVDCVDETTGTRTAGTADTWTNNVGRTSTPVGLCVPGRAPTS